MRVPHSPEPVDAPQVGGLPLIDFLARAGGPTVDGEYVHWDKLRRLTPPAGLNHEQWWMAIKLSRQAQYRTLPLTDTSGEPFVYMLPDRVLESLHRIDGHASGWTVAPDEMSLRRTGDRFIVSSLIEEAISSSQLEGASTARAIAANMIRNGRKPRDVHERMILNNFRAMNEIRKIGDGPMTLSALLDLHRTLTANTLDELRDEGRIQAPGDSRVGVYDNDGHILHAPPPAELLPLRLDAMFRFANEDAGAFVHPVVRAIVLHFWLAYEHPFQDGNGRAARSLFYWCMMRRGYWPFEFISISRLLLNAPARYGRAFLETESDGNDLTYFISHQIDVIQRALDDFRVYVEKKLNDAREIERKLKRHAGLNHRQSALLAHAFRHPDAEYTVRSHRMSHNVANATARTDLLRLVESGLLERARIGRRKNAFFPPADIRQRIEALGPSAQQGSAAELPTGD